MTVLRSGKVIDVPEWRSKPEISDRKHRARGMIATKARAPVGHQTRGSANEAGRPASPLTAGLKRPSSVCQALAFRILMASPAVYITFVPVRPSARL